MERPEWFDEVGAFEYKPSASDTPSADSGIPRMAKRFAIIGASALFAAGSVAFAASTMTGEANAVITTPVATATETATPVATATETATPVPKATETATPVATATETATPTPATPLTVVGSGTRPSIAGGSGDDGASTQVGDDGGGDD